MAELFDKLMKGIRNSNVYPIEQIPEDEVYIDEITTYEILNGINPKLVEQFRVKAQDVKDIETNNFVLDDIEIIDLENSGV
jgi:hypothetical protein